MSEWKRIRKALSPKGHILVTNNITARNANGAMSHVWLTSLVFKNDDPRDGKDGTYKGDFYCYIEGQYLANQMLIAGVTHYCEVPAP